MTVIFVRVTEDHDWPSVQVEGTGMLRVSPDRPLWPGQVREEVLLVKREPNSQGATYGIMFRGAEIARLEKRMVTHDRPLYRGSRITGRRTQSTRWAISGWSPMYYDTRLDAVRAAIQDRLRADKEGT